MCGCVSCAIMWAARLILLWLDLLLWEHHSTQGPNCLSCMHACMHTTSCRLRIYHYYLPVFFWIQQQLQQHKQKYTGQATAPPLVVSEGV